MFMNKYIKHISIAVILSFSSSFGTIEHCDSLLSESAKIDSLQASFPPRPPYPTAQAFREDEMIKTQRKALEPAILPCLKSKQEQEKCTSDSIQNIELRKQKQAMTNNDVKHLALAVIVYAAGAAIAAWLYIKTIETIIPHQDP